MIDTLILKINEEQFIILAKTIAARLNVLKDCIKYAPTTKDAEFFKNEHNVLMSVLRELSIGQSKNPDFDTEWDAKFNV